MRYLLIILLVFALPGYAQAGNLSPKEEIAKIPPEYQSLAEGCLSRSSFNCCMSSVRDMAQGGYPLAALKNGKYECPHGYTNNMLKCADTYQWCEPNKEDQK